MKSITEEGTILSDQDIYRNSFVGKTDEQTQDNIYKKRDPEEEFFMLSVLALKMIATELYDDTEYIYEVKAEELFK